MNIYPGQRFRVSETAGAVVLHDPRQKVSDGTPLCEGSGAEIVDYLVVFLSHRENGMSMQAAHRKACDVVGVKP